MQGYQLVILKQGLACLDPSRPCPGVTSKEAQRFVGPVAWPLACPLGLQDQHVLVRLGDSIELGNRLVSCHICCCSTAMSQGLDLRPQLIIGVSSIQTVRQRLCC